MPSTKRKQGAEETVESSEYEEVPLEGGGFKRRRVGAKQWQRYCEHGRRKQSCKECGGSSICEHGRHRPQCKECGGSSMCKHGRRRSRCKECGGASICEHGRERSRCKECGGSSICKHGRRRSQCKECKAPSSQRRVPGEEGTALPPPGVQSMATVVI